MESNGSNGGLKFDPRDPFPLVYSDDIKEHAADVDRWLGLEVDKVEAKLLLAEVYRLPKGDREFWIGRSPQVFQTPYVELREILELLCPAVGETIVDLGAGYGRMAHVLNRHFSGVAFRGYEFIRERADEGRAAFVRASLSLAALETSDVTKIDFSKEVAKYYFIYDFGSREDIEKTVENMKSALSHRAIVVVARGGRAREIIDKKHLWLSYVVRPQHRQHYTVYRTQAEERSGAEGVESPA